MERYELVDGDSAKFWQWKVVGTDLVVEYGRVGAKGQSNVKSFASAAEAKAAAAKLVKQKTGKGYVIVAEDLPRHVAPTSPATTKPVAPVPAASSVPAVQSSLDETQLAAVAKKMNGKKNGWDQLEAVTDVVGRQRHVSVVWAILERQLLTPKALGLLLPCFAHRVASAPLSALLATLMKAPKTFETRQNDAMLLNDWPTWLDHVLMYAVKQDAAAVDGVVKKLPPNARRALPFVKRRLGLDAVVDESLYDELITHCLGFGKHAVVFLRDGALVLEPLESIGQVRELAAFLAPEGGFDERVMKLAWPGGERKFRNPRLAESLFLSLDEKALLPLVLACWESHGWVSEVLEKRQVSLGFLQGALKEAAKDKGGVWAEPLAQMIAKRLGEQGEPVPDSVAKHIEALDCAVQAWPRTRAALLALPASTRADWLEKRLSSKDAEQRERAAILLAVDFDPALFERLIEIENPNAYHEYVVGMPGLAAVPQLVARLARADAGQRLAMQRMVTYALLYAARSGHRDFDPAWGALIVPTSTVEVVDELLAALPEERRDAVVLRWIEESPSFEMRLFNLATCGDAAVEKAVKRLLDSPKLVKASGEWVYSAVEKVGIQRFLPALAKLAPSHPHAAALLGTLPLTDAEYAAILGGVAPQPALPVLEGKGPKYLSALQAHLAASDPVGELSLTSGRIAVTTGLLEERRVVAWEFPPGGYRVTVHHSDLDLEGLPTAGVDALMIALSDQPTVKWKEAASTTTQRALDGDVIDLCLGDETWLASCDQARPKIEQTLEHVRDDEGVGMVGNDAVVVYVGEVAVEHRLHIGFDAAGVATALLASFRYPQEE
jgi:predicted DNA-binding WGR domain protein